MISVFAPGGVGEVEAGTDLVELVLTATADDPAGPLCDGDIVVITSKILSKSEGRLRPARERDQAITDESVRTVARRGGTRIVRTRAGLTVAAAGVDNSNVDPTQIALLPLDCDASAARLRAELQRCTGHRLGVLVSDTAGRSWRIGQTDQAIGAAGVRLLRHYEGQTDPYGNELQVTAMAVADELAAAADLAKSKLAGRPVAVVRGLAELLVDADEPARDLVRASSGDMFGFGSQEAVLAAALAVTGQIARYEELVALEPSQRGAAILAGAELTTAAAELLHSMLSVDLAATSASLTTG